MTARLKGNTVKSTIEYWYPGGGGWKKKMLQKGGRSNNGATMTVCALKRKNNEYHRNICECHCFSLVISFIFRFILNTIECLIVVIFSTNLELELWNSFSILLCCTSLLMKQLFSNAVFFFIFFFLIRLIYIF